MSMNEQARVDEESPLLGNGQADKKRTPLPIGQISILLLLQLSEPVTALCILPFINQLVSELDIIGEDQTKVGYYAGLIESLYFAAEAVTVLQWSRLSDRIGRKPVLVTGIIGMIISTVAFGLSRTFWTLVISRCICGALNGNVGVMKSMIAEITDETNLSQGLSLMPVTWAVGSTIGPFLGGQLSRPADHFLLFDTPFWRKYPYFLPCAVASAIATIFLIIAIIFLKESLHKSPQSSKPSPSSGAQAVPVMSLAEGAALEHSDASFPIQPTDTSEEAVPMSAVLIYPVLLSISNYAALAFLEIALIALLPLFLSTPIALGGLGLPPPTIGICLGVFGLGNGLFQGLFFSKIVDRWGHKNVFVAAMASFIPIFCLFPIINALARVYGLSAPVWAGIGLLLTIMILMDMAYGSVFVYIISSSPNKRSLGATNGLAQSVTSVQRAIGPAISTSMFALSLEQNIMGGNGVYVLMVLLTCFALMLAVRLPRGMWNSKSEK